MNIFENLIDELKEENLLEKTVIETKSLDGRTAEADKKSVDKAEETVKESGEPETVAAENDLSPELTANSEVSETSDSKSSEQTTSEEKIIDKAEFFRRRATDEVAGLQMVEHVFSGVERQQKKIIPKPYDDLKVKKALHNFLKVCEDVNSPEHAQTEFELMQETEGWYSALSYRDKQISITNLRCYCETAKPALSLPALLSLARFYRNSPYSEAVRSKFDLIVTRLFSKDLPGEKREPTFEREDLIKHLSDLYAEWESIALYEGEEKESEVVLIAFKFEDFISEAQKAESFDELIRNDFFNRLRSFKESAGEKFFLPFITATAVDCNIKIGNRYVELLEEEREKGKNEKLENKYGFLHDQVISDAASKTLQLVELLKNKPAEEKAEIKNDEKTISRTSKKLKKQNSKSAASEVEKASFFGSGKWLLVAVIVVLISSVSFYLLSGNSATTDKLPKNVKKVNIENSFLKEYVKDAKIGNNTFFAVVLPSWDGLTQEKKDGIMKKIVSIGANKGFKNVHLLSPDGKAVAVASEGFIEIQN